MSGRVCLLATSTTTEREDVLASWVSGLAERGWDSRLLCKGDRWAESAVLRDPGIAERVEIRPQRDWPLPPLPLLLTPRRFARHRSRAGETDVFDGRIVRLKPDLVHFVSGMGAWRGLRLRHLAGFRSVVSFRDDARDLLNPGVDAVYQWADLLLFPDGPALRRALANGCPPQRATVLPAAASPPPAASRNGRPPGNAPLRILSYGPMLWERGFEHSLQAVRMLLDRGIDCEYRIISHGSGDHVQAVGFARHQLGLEDHVTILGPGGLENELARADAFVDPAVTGDTSASALVAAQSHGVPVVATRHDEIADGAGLPVGRRDPHGLAEALARLARDPALAGSVASAARNRIERERPAEACVAQLDRLYRRVLDGPGGRP